MIELYHHMEDVMDYLTSVLEKHLSDLREQGDAPKPAPIANPNAPSDAQLKYYTALVDGKVLTDEQRIHLKKAIPLLDKRAVSSTIQWLIGLPWAPRPQIAPKPQAAQPKILEGCYAIEHPTEKTTRFYEVKKPTQGKWAGFVFLSQLSGENHIPIRDKHERELVYGEIAKNPMDSLKRYGQQIGRCGHCRKQLTDETSREIGIGPVCRKALGL